MTRPEESVGNRLQEAYEKFRREATPEEAQRMEEMLAQANRQAHAALQGDREADSQYADFALVHTHLGKGEALPETAPEFTQIGKDGTIWGFRQYEQLDYRWTEAAIKFFEYYHFKAPFADHAQTVAMGNDGPIKIAVAGDWGTGFDFEAKDKYPDPPAKKVATQIDAVEPHWTIHLGDTYYAGTREEIDTKLAKWPRGSAHGGTGAFTIPGNHEMYCGDHFYYKLLPKHFPLQKGTSFFALQNDNWLIIALDSSYHATAQFYMDGSLGQDNPQTRWLEKTLADAGDRQIIIMTHHQPVSLDGSQTNALFDQVAGACTKTGKRFSYWYFGHEHNAALYEESVLGAHGRVVGHGSIPYGWASDLENENVVWAETKLALDERYPDRLLNGFILLEIDGDQLTETLYDENGDVRWPDPA